jgi:glycine/D-amino acid oxidase-like deaminating enzyme
MGRVYPMLEGVDLWTPKPQPRLGRRARPVRISRTIRSATSAVMSVDPTPVGMPDRYFPELRGRPPSAEWIGPMGFSPDQLPAIGMLRPRVVVAAGFSGYGGRYTTAAGEAAAALALTGGAPP